MTVAAPPPPADPVTKAVDSLIHALTPERLGTGPLAELRRMEPATGLLPPAFWKLLIEHVPDDLRQGTEAEQAEAERAWAVIIHGMALMAPEPHRSGTSAGTVLAETGYSEPRFVRLLRAEGEGFAKEVQTACRWLATKAERINWRKFTFFLLSRLHPRFSSDDNRKNQTHHLARAYFSAPAKDNARTTPAQETAQP